MGGENASKPPKILIADDERDLLDMLAFALGRRGYEIVRAHDGLEARERLRGEKFDLLILDLMMPRMDGWEVGHFVRTNEDPRIRETPILILSARAQAADRVRGLEMGAEDYLTKPFSITELALRIEKILGRRQAVSSLKAELVLLQKQTREQEERVCKILHDLKTPLLSMGASAKLLMRPRDTEEALQLLQAIYENSHRLSRRLEEILLLSAASLPERKILLQDIDLPRLAKRLKISFEALAEQKKIELKFHPVPASRPLRGNERWLERALENLLANSLKYTPEGGRVELGGCLNADMDKLEIWVKDNGRGIFPEEIQEVFNPFRRGANAGGEPGMGLGLSLVKEVAELHGGEVRVQSEAGKGSTFSLIFPLREGSWSQGKAEGAV